MIVSGVGNSPEIIKVNGCYVWGRSLGSIVASIDSTVSVSNIDLSDIQVKLSPNPAKDHLKIHLQGITKGKLFASNYRHNRQRNL